MISRPASSRYIIKCLIGLVLCSGPPLAAAQELIAHMGAGIDTLTRNEARLFFTMQLKNWPDGTLVKVYVLPDNNPVHQRFANGVLNLYPYQLRRVWDRQLFSGTGQVPITVSSEQEMRDRVAATPGAIGYVDRLNGDPNLRVLEVR